MLKFTERFKTQGITLNKHEGNQQFTDHFRANMNKTNTDMVQFTKRWNWRLIF